MSRAWLIGPDGPARPGRRRGAVLLAMLAGAAVAVGSAPSRAPVIRNTTATLPTVTSLSTYHTQMAGGNSVEVTGTGFTNAAFISLPPYNNYLAGPGVGGSQSPCPSSPTSPCFTVVSDTDINIGYMPPCQPGYCFFSGTGDLQVCLAGDPTQGTGDTSGCSASNQPGDVISYTGVDYAYPLIGPAAGGTAIDMYGNDFGNPDPEGKLTVVSMSMNGSVITTTPCPATPANGCFEAGGGYPYVHVITPPNPGGYGTIDMTLSDGNTYRGGVGFLFVPPPTVTGVTPSHGVSGHQVTVTGTGFSGAGGSGYYSSSYTASEVDFGTTKCLPGCFTVTSPTTILATPPPFPPGPADVTVVNLSGASAKTPADRFTYDPSTPGLLGVFPSAGPVAGGTEVSLSGTGFVGASKVHFAGPDAASSRDVTTTPCPTPPAGPCFTVQSDTTMSVVTPPGVAGTDDLIITDVNKTSAPAGAAGQFTYAPVPAVTALTPTHGAVGGGSTVTIKGTGFSGPGYTTSEVDFGSVSCTTCFTVNDPNTITAVTPDVKNGGAIYTLDIVVKTTAGTSPKVDADRFTYGEILVPPPPPPPGSCVPVAQPQAGQVFYPAGWSMVGLPDGSKVPAATGWVDQGAGGSYSSLPANQGVAGGHGYWVYFPCPTVVNAAGAGSTSVKMPLGAYHASMVGNPWSEGPAIVSGFDYAAIWDQSLNSGNGGYRLSGYRQPQTIGVGQAVWVFSFTGTTISITAGS